MLARLRRVTKDDQGASAVEYGLLVAAIAAIIVVIVFSFGSVVRTVFADTCTKVITASNESDPNLFEATDCADGADQEEGGEG